LKEFPVPDKVIEIDLPRVAKSSLTITAGAFLFLWILKVVIEREFLLSLSLWTVVFFILGYILLIILHELFHLLGFRVFGGVPWKKMIVGVNLKMGIAYATTNEPLTNRAIRKALLLPFWMTGILPAFVGLYIGSGLLVSLSALLIGGAAGDFAMYKELKKLPDDWVVKDDPELPKLYVYAPGKRIELENFIEK
jgi:Putative zincin peptidase